MTVELRPHRTRRVLVFVVAVVLQMTMAVALIVSQHSDALVFTDATAQIGLPSVTPTPSVAEPSSGPNGGVAPTRSSVANGPGIDAPGISIEFTARSDGSLDVSERVMLRHPSALLTLVPPSSGEAGAAFKNSRPVVRDLEVATDGQSLREAPRAISRRWVVNLRDQGTSVDLRYRLTGTTVESRPSKARRALAFIRPLSAGIDGSLPVQIHARGIGVLNFACPQLSMPESACARGSSPLLFVDGGLSASRSTVIVQLDLPGP